MDSFLPPFHWTNLLIIPGLLMGYTVHELGHALVAYFLGDVSQVEQRRISLNPFRHLSWLGTAAFIFIGIGWAKPLRANPERFRRKYLDLFLVALAGPAASLTFCLFSFLLTLTIAAVIVYVSGATTDQVFALLFPISTAALPQTLDIQAWAMALTVYVASASFWLTVTSLLPLPGMDGFAAIASLVAYLRERRKPAPRYQPGRGRSNLSPLTLDEAQKRRRNSVAQIHFNVGVEYHQNREYDDAIARYRQAIASDQHFGPAYVNMALAYLAKGRRKEAIQALRGAIQFADDRKTETEAWQLLHQVSEVSPFNRPVEQEKMTSIGSTPWTDVTPRPNWLALALGGTAYLLAGIFVYTNLVQDLIALLS
ncbi:MAG: hypothetical protein D6784_04100 [Chloroflexi bacterium]|nr:MAG: hypothetical protein D6784_04100 [Chloroflexota bacterium]